MPLTKDIGRYWFKSLDYFISYFSLFSYTEQGIYPTIVHDLINMKRTREYLQN